MTFTMRYGIDAPFWVAFLIIIGSIFTVPNILGFTMSKIGLAYGLLCLLIGLWMFIYSTIIKIKQRDVILNLALAKSGDRLLDIGTGRGLLAIAAAKRNCDVTATDIWSKSDLSGNEKSKLQHNIIAEGTEQINIVDADARNLPFSDESFDVVVSNFVVHNIKTVVERKKAILEMWRVLRPNGRLVIADFSKTSEYVDVLESVSNNITLKHYYYTCPFSKALVVEKV